MNKQIRLLVIAQLKEFIREPEVLFWSILFPVVLAGILGLAFTSKPKLNAVIPVVGSENQIDELLRDQIRSGKNDRYTFVQVNRHEALQMLRQNKSDIFITISPGDSLIFHLDEANSQAIIIQLSLQNMILNDSEDSKFKTELITSAGNRYIDFLIPGLIAFGIMNSCMWGIGYNLIDFRIKKLLRLMVASPMRKTYFMTAQFYTRLILTGIESLLVFLFALFVFGVTIRGNLIYLLILFVAGVYAFSGIAILTSSRARKSEVGNGLINAVVLPMTILSGIFFSYQGFPEWMISIIEFLPLTMLANGIRSVFFADAELIPVLLQSAGLMAFGTACLLIGLKFYKWY